MEQEKEQKVICKKYNSAYKPLNENAEIALATSTLGQMPIYASRVDADENGVEWYVYCGEFSNAEDFYEPVAIDCLPEDLPAIIPFLALESGFNFIVDDKGYEDVWKNEE